MKIKKNTCTALGIVLLCLAWMSSYAQNIAPGVKRIVFLGNSITWQGNYIHYVEAYLATHYPDRQFEFINLGLPSETVSGLSEPGHAGGSFPRPDLHERLKRILAQTKPDLVLASYGMNDGIYLPFDAGRFQKFKEGITWLHNEVVQTGAKIIHLTPPDYDELKGKQIGYAAVLDKYADWLISRRSSAKWEVIDVHYPMKKYLAAHRKTDAMFFMDGFALAADGVHPGETGHWLMAREILLYLVGKQVATSPGILESISGKPNSMQILKLVTQRQNMMRNAWLTATQHKRPGLPVGMPLREAQASYKAMALEIKVLIQNKPIVEVYLIGGQSNATGQGYMANMTDTMNVNKATMMFHSGKPHLESGLLAFHWHPMHQASESPDRFGPELGFASKIKPLVVNAKIAIIKHAHSGSNLYDEWNPGKNSQDSVRWGVHFKVFMNTVNAGLDSLRKRGYEPLIRGMLWQQGEAEAYSPDSISSQYGLYLKHFISRVREQVEAPQMVFVYGMVCPPPLNSPGIKSVRQAQRDIDQESGMALSVNQAFVIPVDDLSRRANDRNTPYKDDQLHFGTAGTWLLGVRMAEKINATLLQK